MRAALALLALVALPAHAGWVRANWAVGPGASPAFTALRVGCLRPDQYELPPAPIGTGTSGTITVEGLPDSGRCYFALNAGPQDEWFFDFDALKGGPMLPGAVSNLQVSWVPTPAVTASVTLSNFDQYARFRIAVAGEGAVTLSLDDPLRFDWCSPGNNLDTPALPTSPSLGKNGDNIVAKAVTFTAPISGQCDADNSNGTVEGSFAGGTVTYGGIRKPLVQAGSTWVVSF